LSTDDEAFEGLHYFTVDVETSALRTDRGQLLSIGAVVLDEAGNLVDDLYIRIAAYLPPVWYNEELPTDDETLLWWREQNEYAKNEAYFDTTLPRVPLVRAAHQFRNWVLNYGKDWTERVFVASPVQFDYAWVMDMFQQSEVEDPFWYHTLDLFSLLQGKHAAARRGAKKGMLDLNKRVVTNDAVIAHHPLADAFATAQDLALFLPEDLIELDHPSLDGFDEWQADNAAEDDVEPVEDDVEPIEEAEDEAEEVQSVEEEVNEGDGA